MELNKDCDPRWRMLNKLKEELFGLQLYSNDTDKIDQIKTAIQELQNQEEIIEIELPVIQYEEKKKEEEGS